MLISDIWDFTITPDVDAICLLVVKSSISQNTSIVTQLCSTMFTIEQNIPTIRTVNAVVYVNNPKDTIRNIFV